MLQYINLPKSMSQTWLCRWILRKSHPDPVLLRVLSKEVHLACNVSSWTPDRTPTCTMLYHAVPCCTTGSTGSTDCGSVAICHWKWHESLWNVGCVFFAHFEPLHEIHEQCNHGPSQTSKTVQACRLACLEVVDASLQINLSAGHQVANGLTVPKLFWRHVGWRSNLLELSTSQ